MLSHPTRKNPKDSAPRHGHGSDGISPALSARGKAITGVERGAPGPAEGAFQPGLPDVCGFPHQIWARILARHARTPLPERLHYGDAAGEPRLRAAIAVYAAATRGVNCSPEQIVVVPGVQAALDLCARLLLDPGDTAWIEEPGYVGARAAMLGAGARTEPVLVDSEGLDVAAGAARFPHARLAYITPLCQCRCARGTRTVAAIPLLDGLGREYQAAPRLRGCSEHGLEHAVSKLARVIRGR